MEASSLVADLHSHTTVSDGSFTLETLSDAAERADLDWVAVTDHDRIHPGLEAPVVERHPENRERPLRLIRGIELRVAAGDQRVDLLGYGVKRTDALVAESNRLQQNRKDRAGEIVECVEDQLNVELDISIDEGVGRPHIARAIEASEAPLDFGGAFEELIGDGESCYVAREIPDFETGKNLLSEACSIVGLAHPLRYDHPEAALEYAPQLDAVERFYTYGRPVDSDPVEQVAAQNDLLLTGGTDAHELELGQAGLTADQFAPLRNRLPPATPAN